MIPTMSIIIKDSNIFVAVIIDVNMQYRNVGDLGKEMYLKALK